MPISECCNIGVVCCEPEMPVSEVAALMRKHHVGDVIVIETGAVTAADRVPIGILTDRDIVLETIALEVDARIFTAGDIMSTPIVTVGNDEGLVETLRLMRDHKVRRIPVVTEAGTLFGIVAADDIINLLAMELQLMTAAIVDQPMREAQLRK